MNKSFINLKYDAEKGEGIKIAEKYNVRAYPTLLIIDSDGNKLENLTENWLPKKNDMIEVSEKYGGK